MSVLYLWHAALRMPRQDEAWHRKDIEDELQEYREARGWLFRWSELSDLAYTYSRARDWSGIRTIPRPIGWGAYVLGLLYMLPKYTLRWMFYRRAGKLVDARARLTEVRNPEKVHKLDAIARMYGLDPEKFRDICQGMLRWWPLLK